MNYPFVLIYPSVPSGVQNLDYNHSLTTQDLNVFTSLSESSGLPCYASKTNDQFSNNNPVNTSISAQDSYPINSIFSLFPGATIAQPSSLCFLASSSNDPSILTRHQILHQVEFYFSPDNLAKDVFLRRQMDSDGWVKVSVIAKFNRVKSLSSDIQEILEVSYFCVLYFNKKINY